jgi:hypothetical protein
MSVESWNSIFQWGSVLLIAVTFVFGAGALWTGNRINARQTERLVVLETELAAAKTALVEQQERTAMAQQSVTLLKAAISPRWLNIKEGDDEGHAKRVAEVRKYAGTVVAIQAVPDLEAEKLAGQMAAGLKSCGWNVVILTPDSPRVPVGFIQSGVVVTTLEQAPVFPKPTDPADTKISMPPFSRAALAAQALVADWETTLGPPFGPQFFGIHWEPSYPLDSEVPSYWLRGGFKFPKDGVLVLVGQQPIEYLMPAMPKAK